MKHFLLALFLISTFSAHSQIFFSEYAEGSSYNKYLEIYNYSDQIVDLTNFAFPSCSNGCDVDGEWDYMNYFPDGSAINPGDVFVISHPNVVDSEGQYYTEEIAQYSDYEFTYLSNGNDVFALINIDSQEVIDIVGAVGPDPGDGWDVAGIPNATKDHTLVRKSNVNLGNGGNWISSAGTSENDSEWIVLDNETWDYLGFHQCDSCGVEVIYGCTDENAINFNADANIDDGSCEYETVIGCADSTACNYDPLAVNGLFNFVNTESNMTIALEQQIGLAAGLESGDMLAVFYTNNNGELSCAGSAIWQNESIAIAAWGSESGQDNGFDVGENFTFLVQKNNGQVYLTNSSMNSSPPFSSNYVVNGFGQILELTLTELLLDEENCEYPEQYYDCDGNCLNDIDGDGICDEFQISLNEFNQNNQFIKAFDILGKEIKGNSTNKIILKIYQNGEVKKLYKFK